VTHFTCLVIGGDVARQLAPYDRGLAMEPYGGRIDPVRTGVVVVGFAAAIVVCFGFGARDSR